MGPVAAIDSIRISISMRISIGTRPKVVGWPKIRCDGI